MKLKNEAWPVIGTIALGTVGLGCLGNALISGVVAAEVRATPTRTFNGDPELAATVIRRRYMLFSAVSVLGAFACYRGIVAVNR
ncbi:hypothetical protein ACFQDE_16070 [Deinococcus caeni]|uniref:Uncharacterized protein n=1 Tax=Deinococcus caeni TaxID=569127 RepID=A0ABP9UC94_9DEIO